MAVDDPIEQNVPHDESQPLLKSSDSAVSNGAIENGRRDGNAEEDGNVDEVPIAKAPSTGRILIVLGSIWIGVFFAALDSTIVATLSTPISNSFNSFTLLSWVASGFLIANAALQPLMGKLTDIFGRRSGLVLSNLLFGVGTLICGLAKTEWQIILGRVVAGMGGGGINAISTFVASDLVPTRSRGMYQGMGNICYGLGSGLGGVFGGAMNDQFGWRSAFHFQVPFIGLTTLLVYFTIRIPTKITDKSRIKRVDFLGSITLLLSLVLLLLGLNSGGNTVPWTHPLVLTTLPLSFLLLCTFIYIEDRIAPEPVIPVRLLLNRTILCACLTNWFLTMSVFSILYYVPVYFQIRGLSPTAAGARLIPNSIGGALGSLTAGLVMRWTGRYYYLNAVIEAIAVASYALIAAFFNANLPFAPPFPILFMSGFGYGAMLTTTLIALISGIPHSQQAVVTSASYAFRSTGSTIGITISSAVFQNVLKAQLWARFRAQPGAEGMIRRLRDSIEEIRNVPVEWREGVLESYFSAIQGVWYVILGTGALGALISLGMREYKLHTTLDRSK
ncbi:MAG: hypothetical protein M1820_001414 [Bogoriella megaspora]|nr:MAG: hypothetical protein M1820_001414 [Bogoriella megaspora]